jgi:hypothetical protein
MSPSLEQPTGKTRTVTLVGVPARGWSPVPLTADAASAAVRLPYRRRKAASSALVPTFHMVIIAGRPLLAAAQHAGEVRDDLTLEQILDLIGAIARIHGDTGRSGGGRPGTRAGGGDHRGAGTRALDALDGPSAGGGP